MKIEISVYIVEDREESIKKFNDASTNLDWVQRLLEIPIHELHSSFELSEQFGDVDNDKKWDEYVEFIGIGKKELSSLISSLTDNGYIYLSKLPIPLIEINTTNLLIFNDSTYKKALTTICDSPDCTFLLEDVDWGNYSVQSPNLLSSDSVKMLYGNEIYPQGYLGAWNIGFEFLKKGGNRFLIKASSAGEIKGILNLPGLPRDAKDRFYKNSDSIILGGAHALIIEVLRIWYMRFFATPIDRLLYMSSCKNIWFTDSSTEVPHVYPHPAQKIQEFQIASGCLLKTVNLLRDRYDFFAHQGFKSFCLTGDMLGIHTLYSIALLADAQRDVSHLTLKTAAPTYTPDVENSTHTKTKDFDFAKALYKFFKDLLEEDQIFLSFGDSTMTLLSSRPVVGKEDNLLARTRNHLSKFRECGNWDSAHETSKALAKCIEYGGWELATDTKQEFIRSQTGAFLITMQDKEITFSWKEE